MSNVVPMSNKRDWKWHRDRIVAAWSKQVESIVDTGQYLIEAKEELGHGSFEAMVQSHLPFGPRAARYLMVIAKCVPFRKHASDLPPSWATLYELTKLDHDMLMTKLKDGTINPKMERSDAVRIYDEAFVSISQEQVLKYFETQLDKAFTSEQVWQAHPGTKRGTVNARISELRHKGCIARITDKDGKNHNLLQFSKSLPDTNMVEKPKSKKKKEKSADSSPEIEAAIDALVQVTKDRTHNQRIEIAWTVCDRLQVSTVQVNALSLKKAEASGQMNHLVFSKPRKRK